MTVYKKIFISLFVFSLVICLAIAGLSQTSDSKNYTYISTRVEPKAIWVGAKVNPQDSWFEHRTTTVDLLQNYQPKLDPQYSQYGGLKNTNVGATGFFHTKKVGDRWWLVDPDGHLFIHKGVNTVRPGRSENQKRVLLEKFGTEKAWIEETAKLLKANGFNGTGGWSNVELIRNEANPLVYTVTLRVMKNFRDRHLEKQGGTYKNAGWEGFEHDLLLVFEPDFESFVDEQVKQIVKFKDEKYLLGYFSDNELPFVNDALDRHLTLLNENEPGYQAAKQWLEQRKGRNINLNAITDEDRDAFLGYMAERYFSIVSKAIKKYDPNHLYLGSRLHDRKRELYEPSVMKAAGKYMDVLAINYYRIWEPDRRMLKNWSLWSGKPIMITEWYVKGEDSGLSNSTGAGWIVKTQRDRGYAYQNFILGLLKSKVCVGWHWFQYQDNDPSDLKADFSNRDSNKGIVNNSYEPYLPLLEEMKELNSQAYNLIEYFDEQDER